MGSGSSWGMGEGMFSSGTVRDPFFHCLSFFFCYFFLILILHNDVWKINLYSLLKIWRF